MIGPNDEKSPCYAISAPAFRRKACKGGRSRGMGSYLRQRIRRARKKGNEELALRLESVLRTHEYIHNTQTQGESS